MRRFDKKRLELDRRIDEMLQTEEGRAEYWEELKSRCRSESIIALLESTLQLPGDVIECGVFRGRSLQKISRSVMEHAPEKKIYACDSFEGFPEEKVGRIDLGFLRFLSRVRRKFQVCADTPERLQRIFDIFDIQGELVKGYFSDTLPRFANSRFCFIHIDCDIYESHIECLNLLYENLSPGGVVVFDDYATSQWPGATKAVDEFFASRPETVELCTDRLNPSWYVRKAHGR